MEPEPELEPEAGADKNGPAPQHWFSESGNILYWRVATFCNGTFTQILE